MAAGTINQAVQADGRATFLGVMLGIAAGALWGVAFLVPELASAFTPLQIAIGRYLAYGLLAAALLAPRWSRIVPLMKARDWREQAWLALCGHTLFFLCLTIAVQKGGIAMTTLVIGFLPVAVTIIGSRDAGAVRLRVLAPSLLLCAAGALCIAWQTLGVPSSRSSMTQAVGLLCAVGALALWSAFAVSNSRSLARLPHISPQDWGLLTGVVAGLQAVALIPLTLLFEPISHAASAWMQLAGISIAVAIISSIGGNSLWNHMSRLLPLTLVGQMILFETLFALLYGFIWEQRWPTMLESAAFVLVTASVMSCIAAHRRPDAVKAPHGAA
jgi:drug/metabolite transporter (DMT)-like permease